jgi:carboxylesterase type B
MIFTSHQNKSRKAAQAARKTALNVASAYLYWFTWQTLVLGGRPRAFHCAELPFVKRESCSMRDRSLPQPIRRIPRASKY